MAAITNGADSLTTVHNLTIRHHRLNPIEVELWLTSDYAEPRGRFLGPKCRYASTIEVAYPLQPLPRSAQAVGPFTKRVLIPEPSLWTPQTPYLYRADIELADTRTVFHHGFRLLDMRSDGCRLNGRGYPITAVAVESATPDQITAWREQGINALVQSYSADLPETLTVADLLGIFLFVRVDAKTLPDVMRLSQQKHPALAGWLLVEDALREIDVAVLAQEGQHIGVEMNAPLKDGLPAWASFVACRANLADTLAETRLPVITIESPPALPPTDQCLPPC